MANDGSLKKYQCTLCDYTDNGLYAFTDHMITHSKIYPYGCDICTDRFSHTSLLQRHIQQAHDSNKTSAARIDEPQKPPRWNVFACPECDYQGSRIDWFKKHATEHTGLYRYQCYLCSLPFHYAFQLGKHLARRHDQYMDEWKGNVSKCESAEWYRTTAELYRNVPNFKLETNEKEVRNEKPSTMQTYTCEECGIRFASKLRYTSHVFDTHTSQDGVVTQAKKPVADVNSNHAIDVQDVKPSELRISQVYSTNHVPVESWPMLDRLPDVLK